MESPCADSLGEIRSPVGLCLSGGGFRAAAYHLGVLRRLRELGLLGKVDALSTVSGGSIIGALWVYCQARVGDTLTDDDEWYKFERKLIDAMRGGIRGPVVCKALVLALLLISILAGGVAWLCGALAANVVLPIVLGALLLAVECWRRLPGYFLVRAYARIFYGDCRLGDLHPAGNGRRCPVLLMNASGLSYGELALFPSRAHEVWFPEFLRAMHQRHMPAFALEREIIIVPMSPDTRLASAVAASSAVPGVFGTFQVRAMSSTDYGNKELLDRLVCNRTVHAVDGGVVDNQGIHFLGSTCRHVIVSDAASTLGDELSPSWEFAPLVGGVLLRAQAIIYNRVRDLSYRLLQAQHDRYTKLRELLKKCAVDQACIDALIHGQEPFLESYAYVELSPPQTFRWDKAEQRLPELLAPLVAAIRTDLDSFSLEEISALMFHGYTTIDHCLRAEKSKLLPASPPPLKFTFGAGGLFKDWDKHTAAELERARRHLTVSSSHSGLWRRLYRWFKQA